ncbi:MAG: helix-turn-helix transcriptional regulator [Pseudomonadota bacterium]
MVFDPDTVLTASVAVTFALAAFSAVISWLQRDSVPARATLAMFFAAFALSEIDTLAAAVTVDMAQTLRDGAEFIAFTANFCLMPLFLVYVRELAAPSGAALNARRLAGHFGLPAVALFFGGVAMLLPAETRALWYSGAAASGPMPGLAVLHYGFSVLTVLLLLQWALYVVWIARLQAQHITRLKQHFASTEGLELRWVAVLAFAMGCYVLQSLAGELLILLGADDPIGPVLDSFLVMLIVVTLALWGLRPSADLDRARLAIGDTAPAPGQKYERSALGKEQANRIARKLIRAMQEDRLFRDPNLTLRVLARHVGVSTNYASQTLNQELDQSFFEFVNGWRVQEAIPLVEAGTETVLSIAYEVGFNSRSSFYAAFKRNTGLTPSAYKSARSATGSDPATGSPQTG